MAKIISFVNRKGGVGKSTIASQIAFGTAYVGFKTLLISADSQNDSVKLLGKTKAEFKDYKGILSAFNDEKIDKIKITDNLEAITSESLSKINKTLNTLKRLDIKFSKKLIEMAEGYDYVMIDTSPSDSTYNDQIMIHSDHILVPLELSDLAVDAVREVLDYMDELEEDKNKVKLIIPNKYRSNIKDHREYLDLLHDVFGKDKVVEPIPLRVDIERLNRLDKSVFEMKNSEVFENIVREVIQLWRV